MDVDETRGLTRRRLLASMAAGLALAACGETQTASPPEPTAPPGDGPTPPEPAATPGDRPTTTAAAGAVVAPTADRGATSAAAVTATPPPPPATPAAVPTPEGIDDGLRRLDGYGFQAHLYNQNRTQLAALTQAAGFDWLKQQVEWRQTEPIEKGGFDWRELDKVVRAVSRSGIKLFLSVVQAPGWALGDRSHGPPGDPLDFEDFMRAMAIRYRGIVQAYGLWNEANLAREWGYGRIDAGEFVELMLAGHRGVKAGDPDATTVGGALTPAGDVDIPDQQVQAIDDVRFLRQMHEYRDGIVREAFDAWGVHPGGFNNAPDQEIGTPRGEGWNGHGSFYFQRFTQHRSVMEEFGTDDRPIWLTEVGWSTANDDPAYGYGKDNSEQDQAQFLSEAFRRVREQYDYVSHMFVWNLNFQMVVPASDEKYPFGVVRADGSPRPAYEALAAMPKGVRRS